MSEKYVIGYYPKTQKASSGKLSEITKGHAQLLFGGTTDFPAIIGLFDDANVAQDFAALIHGKAPHSSEMKDILANIATGRSVLP